MSERHRGSRAIERMVEYAPSTGGLALWVRHEDDDDPAATIVSTDGATIRYGPAFASLSIDRQVGLVAREVLHIALRHVQRHRELRQLVGDVDNALYRLCAAAIVDSTLGPLAWLRLPDSSVPLDLLLARVLGIAATVDEALRTWDVESLYRAIDDRRRSDGRDRRATEGEGEGQGEGHGAVDDAQSLDGPKAAAARALRRGGIDDLELAADADADAEPAVEADLHREWNERLARAHASDADFSMLRLLPADLPTTRTPWEQVLRTQLARGLSSRPAISWSRPTRSWIANQGRAGPHRRLPWEPGFGGPKPVPRLAVVVDVSGSIDDALMERFASEIEAITRRLEAGLVLVVGDDRVRRVTRFEPGRSDLRDIERVGKFAGGGGTDFTPLLEEADRHRPDLAIVLTDLDGPVRFRPSWPVIWAVPPAAHSARAPFGRKLELR